MAAQTFEPLQKKPFSRSHPAVPMLGHVAPPSPGTAHVALTQESVGLQGCVASQLVPADP
jgi:hypothetical protein